MKTLLIYLILLDSLLWVSCKNGSFQIDNDTLLNAKTTKMRNQLSDSLSILDTTVILKDIERSKFKGNHLTDSMAKNLLYAHFSKKGYYNSENLPLFENLNGDDQKLAVNFSSIFLIDLNDNKNFDGIVTYWITPPYASGHCWQPHKAIIIDTDKGYKITNEEFIPVNYAIDSVSKKNNHLIIYGYDYDCANNKEIKRLRIRIK